MVVFFVVYNCIVISSHQLRYDCDPSKTRRLYCLSAAMFPVVGRAKPQQASENGHGGRDTRQLAVVLLELKTTPLTGSRAEPVDAKCSGHLNRKQRNRSTSPLRHDTSTARIDVGSSKNVSESKTSSNKLPLRDEIVVPVTISSHDCLPSDSVRQSHRFHPVGDPTTTTSKQPAVVSRLPPLLNTDSEIHETTQPRKSEGAVRPLEVCALRLNPDIKSLVTRTQCHEQQSAIGVATKTVKGVSVTSSSSLPHATDAVKLDLTLPLSDTDNENEEKDDDDYDDDDNKETAECHNVSAEKMSMGSSVGCNMPGITVDSCPILSVRIQFCKSQKKPNDADTTTASTTTQSDSGCSSSDGGGRQRATGRTPARKKNAKAVSKPMSTRKAISLSGHGKVVVIDDGVYDQFARRQPPKYLSNRMFDAVLNKRAFSK